MCISRIPERNKAVGMFLLPVVEQEMVRIKLLGVGAPQLLVPMNRYGADNDCTSGGYPNAI